MIKEQIQLSRIYRIDRGTFKMGYVYELFKVIGFNATGDMCIGYFIEYPSILWKAGIEELEEINWRY